MGIAHFDPATPLFGLLDLAKRFRIGSYTFLSVPFSASGDRDEIRKAVKDIIAQYVAGVSRLRIQRQYRLSASIKFSDRQK